jgi:hypothetical protein
MREALERAKHDLAFLGSCMHADPEAPDELFETDVSNTVGWIERALDGLADASAGRSGVRFLPTLSKAYLRAGAR